MSAEKGNKGNGNRESRKVDIQQEDLHAGDVIGLGDVCPGKYGTVIGACRIPKYEILGKKFPGRRREYLSSELDVFPEKQSAEIHARRLMKRFNWYLDYKIVKQDDGTYRVWTYRAMEGERPDIPDREPFTMAEMEEWDREIEEEEGWRKRNP